MKHLHNVVKAKEDVCGKSVKNKAGADLGKIKELVIDKLSGHVAYVVLDSGSFLGLGGKYFALPWEIFHYNNDKDCFCVDINEERLKQAPGFDKDHWPDTADRTWQRTLYLYYGTKPYWE